jgi:hypothetical protein
MHLHVANMMRKNIHGYGTSQVNMNGAMILGQSKAAPAAGSRAFGACRFGEREAVPAGGLRSQMGLGKDDDTRGGLKHGSL